MPIPAKKIVTFTDLKELIDTEGFIEKTPFAYTSLQRCNKLAVISALDIQLAPLSTTDDDQLVAREKLVKSVTAVNPPTAPTASVVATRETTYVTSSWTGATSTAGIDFFNVYINGVFSNTQTETIAGGVSPAVIIQGGLNGIPAFEHGSSYFIEIETVDVLGQVSSTKWGYWIETDFYLVEDPLNDTIIRCNTAGNMTLSTAEVCGSGLYWDASTTGNTAYNWTQIGTGASITIPTPTVSTWYRLRVHQDCATDLNGDGIVEVIRGIYEVLIAQCDGSTDNPPTAPNVIIDDITGTDVTISWSGATDDNGIAGYDIYWSDDGGITKNYVETVLSGVSTHLFSSLTYGETYRFYVVTMDTFNQFSDYSGYVDAQLFTPNPIALTWEWISGTGAGDLWGEIKIVGEQNTLFTLQVEVLSESGTWHLKDVNSFAIEYLYDTDVPSVPYSWYPQGERLTVNQGGGYYYTYSIAAYRQVAGTTQCRVTILSATNYAQQEFPSPITFSF